MKKLFLFALLLCFSIFQSQAINFIPEAGTKYYIVATGTGLVIGGLPSNQPSVNNADKLATQRFEFIPVSGLTDTYYLKNDTSYYLGKWYANAWSTTYTTTIDGANSEWLLDGATSNTVRLKVNSSGYIGYNSATDRPLWCDKNNSFASGVFKLIKVSDLIQNNIFDGGFEYADAEGTPIGTWVNDLGKAYGGGTNSRIQASTGYESSGSKCFLLNFQGSSDANSYNSISTKLNGLIPGATYQLNFKYKQSISGASDATTKVFAATSANLNYSNALGTVYTTIPSTNLTSSQTASSGTFSFTAPVSGTCYIVYAKTNSSASYNLYIDDLVLTKTADPNPIITTSTSYLVFDEVNTTASFNVSGFSLTDPITIASPTGFSADKASLSATASGVNVTITYDAQLSKSDYITLSSGTANARVRVIGKKNTDCFVKLYPSLTNIITEPYLNSLSSYGGWGSKSITKDTTKVYCGSSCVALSGACGTSLDYNLTGKVSANKVYRFKAMINTNAELSFTLNGCGINNSTSDYQVISNTSGSWQAVDFSFTTGTLAGSQNLWINSCSGSNRATIAYLDNMELYDITSISTETKNVIHNSDPKVFVNNNQIFANIDLEQASNVEFTIYNIQGMILCTEKHTLAAGQHLRVIDSSLSSGAYLVRIMYSGKSVTQKIIK